VKHVSETRYVYIDERWHAAGFAMRWTECNLSIPTPVYSSSSTGGEPLCGACEKTKMLTHLRVDATGKE